MQASGTVFVSLLTKIYFQHFVTVSPNQQKPNIAWNNTPETDIIDHSNKDQSEIHIITLHISNKEENICYCCSEMLMLIMLISYFIMVS